MILAFTQPLADSARLVAVNAHFVSGHQPSGQPQVTLNTLLIRDALTSAIVTPSRDQLNVLCAEAERMAGLYPVPPTPPAPAAEPPPESAVQNATQPTTPAPAP